MMLSKGSSPLFKRSSCRAYALVTVLSMILMASLIGSFFLKKSSLLSELSSTQARQSALKNQSSAIFNEVARSFTFYLEQRLLADNSEPADLLSYTCSESGTTPCFDVGPFKSRGISISIFCRGQGTGESYVSNICNTERIFPKDFFAEIQIRNPEEKNELLTASGEMRVEPEPLNAYALGLSNIDAPIQFGSGSYLGNMALNFTNAAATATFKPKDGQISISEAIITNDISKLVFQGDVTYPGAKQLPDLANFNQAFVEGFERAAATPGNTHILVSSSSSEIELPNLPNNWTFNGDGNLVDEAGDPITNLPCKDGNGDEVSGGCNVLGVWQAPEGCSFSPEVWPITLREPWELRLKANVSSTECETSHIRRQKRWREYNNYLILKLSSGFSGSQFSEYFASNPSHSFYIDGWEQVNSFVYYGGPSGCENVPSGQTWVRIHLRKTETTEVGPVNLSDKTLLDFDDPAGITLLSQADETMASSCRDKTLAVRTQGPMILMNSFQNIGDAADLGTAFFAKNFILPRDATWICDAANPATIGCATPKDFLFEASLIATDPAVRTIDLGSIHTPPSSALELDTLRVVGGRVGGKAANTRIVNSSDGNFISGFENVEYIFQPNQSPALKERVFVGNLTVSVLSFHIHSSDPKEALAEVGLEWEEPKDDQIFDSGVVEMNWGMDTPLDDLQ